MTLVSGSLSFFLCLVPFTYLAASALVGSKPKQGIRRYIIWPAMIAPSAAVLAGATRLLTSEQPFIWLSPEPVSIVMLVLITFIGAIIIRFSANYLAGETREQTYYQNLFLTLAAVSLTVITNNLLILLVAWIGISLSLHRLLLFYPNRPRAVLAAHKKFLIARVAEASLLLAAIFLYVEHRSWEISTLLSAYPKAELTLTEQLAAALLALAALLKCAQLPVHGWLIQVVEAPTPVSALLHAGIINLGGYLLILFSPLLTQAVVAQWLLLMVAGVTLLLAGLISLTRVSIKVRLAWSTSAQMGLMLVECALGLYELALLHLVAHSCYKAFAFLSAGNTVEHSLILRMAVTPKPKFLRWVSALVFSVALTVSFAFATSSLEFFSPWLLVIGLMTLFFAEGRRGFRQHLSLLAAAAVLLATYSIQKVVMSFIVPATPNNLVNVAADLWICFIILLLFAGYGVLTYAKHTNFGKQLWHILFAGLYLDEWLTRLTFALWPARIPASINAKQPAAVQESYV